MDLTMSRAWEPMTVEELVGKVFRIDSHHFTDATSRDAIEQWDSMGHLSLITELEEHFHVRISIADAMEMVSIGEIKEILRKYGAAV
jgi:acyl carrier protein